MRLRSGIKHIWWLGIIALLWGSCTPYKGLEKGQFWVKKNTVTYTDTLKVDKKRGIKGDLLDLAKPKATRGPKIGQWVKYRLAKDTSKSFNRWLSKAFGRTYSIFDSITVSQSAGSMEQQLFNKGYFKARVTPTFERNEKKRWVKVTYEVEREQLTWVRKVIYDIDDPSIKSLILEERDDSKLQPDQPFDVENIVSERNRIATKLLNNGYYTFNKQYLLFELDTLYGSVKQLDVYVQILPPQGDSTFHVYTVGDIYIYPDQPEQLDQTVLHYDTLNVDGKYILTRGELKYTPQALFNNVALQQGKLYSRQHYQTTLNRFTSLQIFSFVNVEVKERFDSTGRKLDFHIKLIPAKQREITFSLNATTGSTYLLGSDVGVNYVNKNLFRYTDIFNLGVSGGVEMQSDSARNLFLNTLSLSGEATFSFPKFLAPFRVKLPKNSSPRTDFVLRYEYFRRLGYYTQNVFNFTYGFDWNEFGYARHRLNPVEINYVRLTDTTSAFNESLQRNPSLQKSFQDQLIIGTTYSYTKNTAHLDRKNLWVFRLSGDVAGNLLYGVSSIVGQKNSEGKYTIFGRAFSQYVKPEGEIRHYIRMRNNRQVILRLMSGVGISYGNSEVMPYVKQYIVGGSNSLRGFRVRDLGPGAYRDTLTSDAGSIFNDKSGDIKIEGNVEYRFPIVSVIKGAVFMDVGNVWLLRNDPNFPEGDFAFNRFYRELAVNTGLGLRLDFSFFILRFDLGMPLRDPRIAENNGWRFDKYFPFTPWKGPWLMQNVVFNLAIGYPF